MLEPQVTRHRRRLRRVPWLAAPAAALLGVAGLLAASGNAPDHPLRYHADLHHFLIGSAVDATVLATDPEFGTVLGREFNYVTPERELTWDATEPARGSFSFGTGDAIVRFAQAHGQKVRGHTLVWHSHLPAWLTSTPQSQLRDVMRAHITGVAGHYSGQIHAWDVVTDPLNDDGTLRDSPWLAGLGPGYVAEAFQLARAADPAARLYLNEYGADGINEKSTGLYELVKSLRSAGVPIDGVGLQAHLIAGQVPVTLQQNIERFAELGLEVAITGLDVRVPLPATQAKLDEQAEGYRAVLDACLAVARCVSLTTWGLSDKYSWIDEFYPGQGAACLYDSELRPKLAYRSVQQTLTSAAPLPRSSSPAVTPLTLPTPPVVPATAPPTAETAPLALTPACTVRYGITSQWPDGFQAEIAITNLEPAPVNGWTLHWAFANGQAVTQAWGAVARQSGGTVSASNVDWNARIPPHGSAGFGFLASRTATNARPIGFTLNGRPCATR